MILPFAETGLTSDLGPTFPVNLSLDLESSAEFLLLLHGILDQRKIATSFKDRGNQWSWTNWEYQKRKFEVMRGSFSTVSKIQCRQIHIPLDIRDYQSNNHRLWRQLRMRKRFNEEQDLCDSEVCRPTNYLLWVDQKTEITQFSKVSERDTSWLNDPQELYLYVDKSFDSTWIYLGDGSRGIFCGSWLIFVSITAKTCTCSMLPYAVTQESLGRRGDHIYVVFCNQRDP